VPSLYYTTLSYWWLLKESVFVVPILLVLLSVVIIMKLDREPSPTDPIAAAPRWEISAAAALLFVPFVCYGVARAFTGAFHYRYTLVAISGLVILGVYVLRHAARPSRGARVSLLIALTLGACFEYAKTAYESIGVERGEERRTRIERLLPESALPIVCGSRSEFFEAVSYGSSGLRDRMHYLVNRKASLARIGNDDGQWAILNIAPLLPGRIDRYDEFLRTHRSFVLVNPLPHDWLLPQLLEDGASVSIIASSGDDVVMGVEMPPG
jgi:hypothetical protein